MKHLLLVLALLLALSGIGANTIAITAIVEHPALDMARKGILDELAAQGFLQGQNLRVEYQNAQGDTANAVAIARQFVGLRPDVIVGIATPSAQALVNATADIPIVFSAVTDPVLAGLVASFGSNSGNVVGISDMTPVGTQIRLASLVFPEARRIGIVYNTGEANSVSIRNFAKRTCDELGLQLVDITGSSAVEMVNALNAMISDVDLLYIGTDNTAASSIESISRVAERENVPIIAGDISIARVGGLIGFGFDYYVVGRETGKLVAEILRGISPDELETKIVGQESLILFINLDVAERLGVAIPESLLERAQIIVSGGEERSTD